MRGFWCSRLRSVASSRGRLQAEQAHAGRVLSQPAAARTHLDVFGHVKRHGPCGDQLLLYPWEEIAQDLQPAEKQDMILPGLRHARPWAGTLRQNVTVEDQHLVEVIGKHTRGPQAGDAGAEDQGRVQFGLG